MKFNKITPYPSLRLRLINPPPQRMKVGFEPTPGENSVSPASAGSNRPKVDGTTAYHPAVPGRTDPRSAARRRIGSAGSNRPKVGGTTAYHPALPGRTDPRSVVRRRITRLCRVEPTKGRWYDGVSPGSAGSNRPKVGGATAYHPAVPGRTDPRSVARRRITRLCRVEPT